MEKLIMKLQNYMSVIYRDKKGKLYYHGLGNKIYFDKDLTLTYKDLSDFSKSLFE